MRNKIGFLLFAIGGWLMVACSSKPKDVTMVTEQPAIYPDYVGVTVPVGIAPLNFNVLGLTLMTGIN